jgi:hypothetical protein
MRVANDVLATSHGPCCQTGTHPPVNCRPRPSCAPLRLPIRCHPLASFYAMSRGEKARALLSSSASDPSGARSNAGLRSQPCRGLHRAAQGCTGDGPTALYGPSFSRPKTPWGEPPRDCRPVALPCVKAAVFSVTHKVSAASEEVCQRHTPPGGGNFRERFCRGTTAPVRAQTRRRARSNR